MKTETQEHRQMRLQVERQYGIGLGRPENYDLTEAELHAKGIEVKARHNRRAGARALINKYGYETACRITGRNLQR